MSKKINIKLPGSLKIWGGQKNQYFTKYNDFPSRSRPQMKKCPLEESLYFSLFLGAP